MDVDRADRDKGKSPELKIRGQADAEKKKVQREDDDKDDVRSLSAF